MRLALRVQKESAFTLPFMKTPPFFLPRFAHLAHRATATLAALLALASPARAAEPAVPTPPGTPAQTVTPGQPGSGIVATPTLPATTSPTDIRAESALFLAVGQSGLNGPESFVIPVSGAARIAEVRQFLSERTAGTERRTLVATVIVGLGNDGTNRNLSAPGTPAWGWQVTEFVSVRRAQLELELYPAILPITGRPSDIEDLLKARSIPDNRISLIGFPIVMELGSAFPRGDLANVSDRGFAGTGNNAKITGFVVDGTAPRSVLVRVLGPSLTALGVPGALANPRFEIYRGTEKIAENDDWAQGNLNRPVVAIFPPPSPFHLIPTDQREPALELSLPPGAYTVIVSGANGTTGIVLTEIYTL